MGQPLSVTEIIGAISSWLQLIITLSSVIALIITVGKAASKPNKTQDARLDALESWKDKVEARLETGNKHFSSLDKYNEVSATAMIAMLDAQITGDNKAELEKAKVKLNEYLVHAKTGY